MWGGLLIGEHNRTTIYERRSATPGIIEWGPTVNLTELVTANAAILKVLLRPECGFGQRSAAAI